MRTGRHGLSLSQWTGLAVLLIAVCGCPGEDKSQSRPGPMVGKAAPAFRIQGVFNEPYSLETFKGHILVMQFGSSW